MPDIVFVDGLIVKEHTFGDGGTIQKLSFKVEEMIQFLQLHNNDGWVNAVITKSREGKPYAKLDTWKPNQQPPQQAQQSYQGNFPQQEAPQQVAGQQIPQSQADENQDVPF